MNNIKDKVKTLIYIQKEIKELSAEVKEKRTRVKDLEVEIQEYMEKENLDKISVDAGEITLYDRKSSQKFKKESIKGKLQGVVEPCKIDSVVDSIIDNKDFVLEQKLKTKINP